MKKPATKKAAPLPKVKGKTEREKSAEKLNKCRASFRIANTAYEAAAKVYRAALRAREKAEDAVMDAFDEYCDL